MNEQEKVMGLSVDKELVDKYWDKRVNKPLDERTNWSDVKPIKSKI